MMQVASDTAQEQCQRLCAVASISLLAGANSWAADFIYAMQL